MTIRPSLSTRRRPRPSALARGARVVALGVCLVASALSTAGAVCSPPRCLDVAVPVPSSLRVPENTVRILLPEGYDTTRRRYPVLYLLHGAGDTYTAWTELTDVEDFSAPFPLIIVMPDGGRDADAGFYSDWVDGSRDWETFHTRVLRRFVDTRFRTLSSRKHRAIAGLSMGGFGAMSYAARHRDLFAAAASFSGAVDSLYPSPATNVLFVSGVVSAGVWGDPAGAEATWRAHNPTDLARSLRNVALFLSTGDGTRGGPAGDVEGQPGAYGVEQVVDAMTRSFAGALDEAGVAYVADYHAGYHGWPYWERDLHWALPQILAVIGDDEARCADRVSGGAGTVRGSHPSTRCKLPTLALPAGLAR